MSTTSEKLPTLALGNSLARLLMMPAQLATTVVDGLGERTAGGCAIPTPCWEPKHAGDCVMRLAAGQKATVRLHIMNGGWTRQVVAVTALGRLAGWLSFSPTALMLDPQEQATIIVSIKVPEGISIGQRLSGPVLIRGCRDHFVGLDITVDECNATNCCDVAINDYADHVHHWYDHFYCPRPCNNVRLTKDDSGSVAMPVDSAVR